MKTYHCIAALSVGVFLSALAWADAPGASGPQVSRPLVAITGMSPVIGETGTPVVLRTIGLFASGGSQIQEVDFGGIPSANVSVDSSGQITASAPAPFSPGMTVPVTVKLANSQPGDVSLASPVQFSYLLAALEVEGPRPYNPKFGGDPAWISGGGLQSAGWGMYLFPDTSIPVNSLSPILHVATYFFDDTAVNPPSHQGPNFSVGNQGIYSANLQLCDITQPTTTTSPCTDYAGIQGGWVGLPSPPQSQLTSSGPNQAVSGDIAVQIPSTTFSLANLVRTFRLTFCLGLHDTNASVADGSRIDCETSNQFNVVVTPTAFLQTKVLPYTILYQPPGDQSTVTFTASQSYATNFTMGTSNEQSNKGTDATSQSFKYSANLGTAAAKATGGFSEGWDQSTSTGWGTSQASSQGTTTTLAFSFGWGPTPPDLALVPGSGATCSVPLNCLQLVPLPGGYFSQSEPFWNDRFVLLIHPQFAVWVIGKGQAKYVMTGAVPVVSTKTVLELYSCYLGTTATGQTGGVPGINPCDLDYTDAPLTAASGGAVTYTGTNLPQKEVLTPQEAANLLSLDPFYAGGQGAALSARRALALQPASYGEAAQEPSSSGIVLAPTPVMANLSNTTATTTNGNDQTYYSSSVTWSISSGLSIGEVLETGFGGYNVGADSNQKTNAEADWKVTYTDSTAITTQQVTTAMVVLNDVDNTVTNASGTPVCKVCHPPLPLQPTTGIFLDKIFGSFMFQDLTAPAPFHSPGLVPPLILLYAQEEDLKQRFSDVPNGLAANAARAIIGGDVPKGISAKATIGILARAGIMAGNSDGTFGPSTPLTRSQLVIAVDKVLNLPQTSHLTTFPDVPAGDPLAPYVAAAANAGLLVNTPNGRFGASDHVSRQEMAAVVARAFRLTAAAKLEFTDNLQIAPWAKKGVEAVTAAGYLSGFADGTFKPRDPITRAEAAVVLLKGISRQ